MTNNLDALPTALCVESDDHVVPSGTGRGRRPKLTDAELVRRGDIVGRHGGRTPHGVFARITQRLLVLAACI